MLRIPAQVRLFSGAPDQICWMTEKKQGTWTAPHAGTLATLLQSASETDSVLDVFQPGPDRRQAAETVDSMISMGLIESCTGVRI